MLLDTDNFYSYEFERWVAYNDIIADYSNVDYVIYYLRDNLYEPFETVQPFSDIYDVDFLQASKYNLSKRIEQWVAYLSVTDNTYSELIYYKGFVEFKGSENGGTYTYLIDDKYINYLNNTNYAWVVSFQSLSDFNSTTSTDLTERKFVDYFIYISKSHFLQMDCPYGNGIDNDKSLIFKNENLGSILEDNIAGSFSSDGSFTPITSSDNSLFDDFSLDSDGIKELGAFIKSIFSLTYNALPSEVVAIFGVLLSAYIIIGLVKLIISLGL